MVSIIIPNFNRSAYLSQCLESIKNQTSMSWEALVVDDGSTDDSKLVVDRFQKQDSRFLWIKRNTDVKGAAACRNLGLQRSKGTYIIFLDSDDLLAPHCIEQRLSVMTKNPRLDFTVFKMQFFNNVVGDDNRLWNLDNEVSPLERFLKLDAVWQTTGPIWKRDAVLQINGFNETLHCWQDIDIHLKALLSPLKYQLFYEMPIDCYYRKNSENSISQSNTNTIHKLESKYCLLRWLVEGKVLEFNNLKPMILHILVSAINGGHKHMYNTYYKEMAKHLSKQEREDVKKIARIQFLRLTKLKYFRIVFNQIKSRLVKPSTIGKYTLAFYFVVNIFNLSNTFNII